MPNTLAGSTEMLLFSRFTYTIYMPFSSTKALPSESVYPMTSSRLWKSPFHSLFVFHLNPFPASIYRIAQKWPAYQIGRASCREREQRAVGPDEEDTSEGAQ